MLCLGTSNHNRHILCSLFLLLDVINKEIRFFSFFWGELQSTSMKWETLNELINNSSLFWFVILCYSNCRLSWNQISLLRVRFIEVFLFNISKSVTHSSSFLTLSSIFLSFPFLFSRLRSSHHPHFEIEWAIE